LIFKLKTTLCLCPTEGNQQGDDAIRVLSNDGLEVVIDLQYRVSAADAQQFLKKLE
jgi:hypothetical protein